ncbi:hypothetical protein ACWGDS_17685 [Streptomyces sp. NPDC055059]
MTLGAARQDLEDAQDQVVAARRRLADARAQPTRSPCDGCHHERPAAMTRRHDPPLGTPYGSGGLCLSDGDADREPAAGHVAGP